MHRMDVQQLTTALAKGDWRAADRMLAPHTRQTRAHPSLLFNHGKVKLELARFHDAITLLQRCVEAAPTHAGAWFELARAALEVNAPDTALEGFEQALLLDPKDTDARRNLGRVALRLGRYDLAQHAWAPLAGDAEADLALYRIAAETRDPNAAKLRDALLRSHPNRAAVVRTLGRVAKGAMPLRL